MSPTEHPTSSTDASLISDLEVIDRVLDGEPDLFEIIMRRYNRRLYRVARSILGADDEVEDVMQTAYIKAYTHLNQFAGRARFSTWLTRIAIHEALARKKRRMAAPAAFMRSREKLEAVACKSPGPLKHVVDQELTSRIHSAIDCLPLLYRVVFVMRELEGISTENTARDLNVSQDVVKSRLYRAKASLRQTLQSDTSLPRSDVYPFHLRRCDRVVAGVIRAITRRPNQNPCNPI